MRLVGVLCVLACLLLFLVGCPAQQPTSTQGVPAAEGGPEAVTGVGAPPVVEPAPIAPPSMAVGGTTYVVKPGDTLFGIARRVYGDGKLWTVIRDANRGKVTGDSGIKAGTELVIPPKP